MNAVNSSCAEAKHSHARRREQHQRIKFRDRQVFALKIRTRREHHQNRHQANQQTKEKTKNVQLNQPVNILRPAWLRP